MAHALARAQPKRRVPSAAEAWSSLQTLNQNVPLGWYIRALHGWGSNFMVAIVLIHMAQVFLFGAYKYHRLDRPSDPRGHPKG
jgi:quinol-cytochrome oxidoreductase complex cytochrome b subunit